jgi:hypothetical protein
MPIPTSVEVAAAGDSLYDLMDVLREAGVTVEDVRTVQPELEAVFVDLTETTDTVAFQISSERPPVVHVGPSDDGGPSVGRLRNRRCQAA